MKQFKRRREALVGRLLAPMQLCSSRRCSARNLPPLAHSLCIQVQAVREEGMAET